MLSPIPQTPIEKESKESVSAPTTSGIATTPNTPVFELMEEVRRGENANDVNRSNSMFSQLTPKRPLRSEAEKEKRLSRTQSVITTSSSTPSKVDNASVSGESSNSRNSISE